MEYLIRAIRMLFQVMLLKSMLRVLTHGGSPQIGDEVSALTPMESAIEQEVFGLEMGYGLLVLADKKKGGDLLDRITGARTNLLMKWGCYYSPLECVIILN